MTTITYTLPNFPQLNQLHEVPGDGYPDANASWDCVPTSLSDGLRFLLQRDRGTDGTPFDGDGLRDKVYGAAYRGGQAASAYVDYCRSQGVALTAFNGTPAALVQRIHAAILAGHPVIATIPSMWGLGRDGARRYAQEHNEPYTTHVVCFCGYGPGALRASNPWIAPQWHDGDDAYWTNDLEDDQIWLMEREEETLPIGVPAGWTDDGTTLTAPVIGYGVLHVMTAKRQYILTHPWDAANVPLNAAYGIAPAAHTRQDFRDCALVWDGANVSVVAYGPEVLALRAQIAALQHQPPAPAPAPADPEAQAALMAWKAVKEVLRIIP